MKYFAIVTLLAAVVSGKFVDIYPDDYTGLRGLQIGVLKRIDDCPRRTRQGDFLKVKYRGVLLEDGKEFDGNLDSDSSFDFTLGRGEVIKGWEVGLLDMCVGEKRKLKIPAAQAYGTVGSPPSIPSDADLVFEVELIDVVPKMGGPELDFPGRHPGGRVHPGMDRMRPGFDRHRMEMERMMAARRGNRGGPIPGPYGDLEEEMMARMRNPSDEQADSDDIKKEFIAPEAFEKVEV